MFRPWHYIWVATISGATHLTLKMSEHHLLAAFASVYEFVDDSGLEAPAGAIPEAIWLPCANVDDRHVRPHFRGKNGLTAAFSPPWRSGNS